MSDEKKYPIGGYAPGNYYHKCSTCGKDFQGDKLAIQCEPCAIENKEFNDALTPKQRERFAARYAEIVKLFFEVRDLKEESKKLRDAIEAVQFNNRQGDPNSYHAIKRILDEALKQKT